MRLQLADLASLLAEQGLALQVEDAVAEFIARQGFEPEYEHARCAGAGRQLENPLPRNCWRIASEVFRAFASIWRMARPAP